MTLTRQWTVEESLLGLAQVLDEPHYHHCDPQCSQEADAAERAWDRVATDEVVVAMCKVVAVARRADISGFQELREAIRALDGAANQHEGGLFE